MTFPTPLRYLTYDDPNKVEAAERARMIRDGRAWLETHMDSYAPWGFDDECCLTATKMLKKGRAGIDVIRYVIDRK
jgi:hypothetical protein